MDENNTRSQSSYFRGQHYPDWISQQPRTRIVAAASFLYAAAVIASMLLAGLTLNVSTVWLPAGVGLVSVLLWGYWLLPILMLVHIAVSFTLGELSLIARIGMGAIATAEIGSAAYLLNRGRERIKFKFDLAGTARFAAICLLVVPLSGGMTVAFWLWAIGVIRGDEIFVIARNWWLAVAVGMLCITSPVINWMVEGRPRLHGQRREAVIVLAALAAPSVFIFASQLAKQDPVEGVLYASLPILLWASFFLRETGAAVSFVLFTALAITANVLLPAHAIPIWMTAAHLVAFGLMSLVTASAQSNLERVISARARQKELEELAYADMLTGLPNRNRLMEALDKAMIDWQRAQEPFAILMIDLDDFKPVNDRYGHHAGDEVLRIIGERLRSICKKDDLIARFGGDEFVAVLRADGSSMAQAVAERILFAISQPISVQISENEVSSFQIGASIGVALSERGAKTVEALLNQADMASYEAKQTGGARVVAT